MLSTRLISTKTLLHLIANQVQFDATKMFFFFLFLYKFQSSGNLLLMAYLSYCIYLVHYSVLNYFSSQINFTMHFTHALGITWKSNIPWFLNLIHNNFFETKYGVKLFFLHTKIFNCNEILFFSQSPNLQEFCK